MPDYMYMLESRLSPEQRAAMIRVQEVAVQTGSNIYLVGGAVRDLVSGMPIRDLDFTVEGNPSRIAHELVKGGARIVSENEKLRGIEMIFPGDVDGSLSAARDDVFARPGTRPEIRWSSVMEDLHRRDFSLNAIAISLNAASRGLLLDPTNGLADLENREIRALSIHSFTNQPIRLLRALRYSARMEFHLEARTAEWFALAMERNLVENISPEDIGAELRHLASEEKPAAILKSWEAKELIGVIHPQLTKRHPHYELLGRILRARDDLRSAGLQPRLAAPVTLLAVLGRLKPRERVAALHRLEFRAVEIDRIAHIEDESPKIVKTLTSRKTATPGDAYSFLEKTPGNLLAMAMAESSNSKALNKIRSYLQKWRPLRQALPAAALELENLGMARGPKFDKVIADLFNQQLVGKGRSPEDRIKLLRKLSGIKEVVPKKIKEESGKEKKKSSDKLKNKLVAKGKSAPAGAPGQTLSREDEPARAKEAAAQQKKKGATLHTKGSAGDVRARSQGKAGAQKPAKRK